MKETDVTFLEKQLHVNHVDSLQQVLRSDFRLGKEKQKTKKKLKKSGAKKAQMSSSKRRQLGLYKISKKGLKFEELLPIHACWSDYFSEHLDVKHLESLDFQELEARDGSANLFWKSDLHGCFLKVVKSKSPSLVGLRGLLILETKSTVKLLGEDGVVRCVPKNSCEFQLRAGGLVVNFSGKTYNLRPTERSRKTKSNSFPEFF